MQDLAPILQEISDFVRRVAAGIAPPDSFTPAKTFYTKELGGLMLDQTESLAYDAILEKLCPDEGTPTARSRAATDRLLQECVLKGLDILEKQKGKDLDVRIACAMDEMKAKLRLQPVRWQVWRAIDRLVVPDDGLAFGEIIFCKASHAKIAKAQATTAAIIASCPDPKSAGKQSDIWPDDFVKGTLCTIPVVAHDAEAAREIAEVKLETILGVLNFFGSLVLPIRFLPIACVQGSAQSYNVTHIVLEESDTGGYSTNHAAHRFTVPFDLKKLDADLRIRTALQRANDLLKGKGETDYRERLVTAMKWAGKGAVAENIENAFLFYAIALEGLILGGKHHEQLAYKLRLRAAHLLGLNSKGRSRVRDRIRDLYEIRSKIAHAGSMEIPKSDLEYLRVVTSTCIIHLLSDERLSKIDTDDALEQWFEDCLMRGDGSK